MSDGQSGVHLGLPLPDEQVFRYGAMDDVLEVLFRHPHREFSVTELRDLTGHGGKTMARSLELLAALDLIESEYRGRRRLVGIDHRQVTAPDDPLLEIPDPEFRPPVAALLAELEEIQSCAGVVLFGSVARGTADRTSDVDLFVLVDGDLPGARRAVQDAVAGVEDRRFDGERYEFQPLVESVSSAKNYGGKLEELLAEGLVLHRTDALDALLETVLHGG